MVTFTITITDTENKAMEWCAEDVGDWVDNALHNRARIAIEDIIKINADYCNENEIAIGVGRTAQVNQAYNLGIVTTAAARNSQAPAT